MVIIWFLYYKRNNRIIPEVKTHLIFIVEAEFNSVPTTFLLKNYHGFNGDTRI